MSSSTAVPIISACLMWIPPRLGPRLDGRAVPLRGCGWSLAACDCGPSGGALFCRAPIRHQPDEAAPCDAWKDVAATQCTATNSVVIGFVGVERSGPPAGARTDHDMALRARLAAIGRVRTDRVALFLAAIDEESIDARDQSVSPARWDRSSMWRWIWSQSPAPAGHTGAAGGLVRQALLRDRGIQHEQDANRRLSAADPRTSAFRTWRLGRKQRCDPCP